jgi:hypothetical protein
LVLLALLISSCIFQCFLSPSSSLELTYSLTSLTEAAIGVPLRKHLLLPFLTISSITTGNKLVSKEVGVYYHGHMLQEAGYQEVPYSLSWEHYLRNIPFETCYSTKY